MFNIDGNQQNADWIKKRERERKEQERAASDSKKTGSSPGSVGEPQMSSENPAGGGQE